jgi:hypothetical protein
MIDSNYNIKKALVALTIEKTLLEMGSLVLQEVSHRLFEEYHCYIPDCYEKPEHLKKVLKDIYDKSYNEIVSSIQEKLKDFTYHKSVEKFLQVLTD